MTHKFRWGIIGCADIAIGSVIPGIQQSQTSVVQAIASRNGERAREVAVQLNIPKSYGSYEALLNDEEIDAVYIPLPNHLHKQWTIKAAEAGKHVLVEKPIALNAQEAEEMVAACAQHGVTLVEAFMYRHHPRYAKIAEIIRSGEIGELRSIHSNFTFNNAEATDNIRFKKEMGGGSIYDVGVYPISAGRMITGHEPEAVTVQAKFSAKHDDVDMMASGLIEFPNDIGMTFDCGMWAAFRNYLEILGTKGRIEVPSAFVGDANFIVYSGDGSREETFEPLNAYSLQADQFANSVRGVESLRYAPTDAVYNMKVVDACLQSARERVRVSIS